MEDTEKIIRKLDAMEDRIIAMDTAIRGDEPRGVLGMKQHIEGLHKNFIDHVVSDTQQFKALTEGQKSLNETISKVRWWVLGASAVFTLIVGAITVISKIL